jgi:hypothetical protein
VYLQDGYRLIRAEQLFGVLGALNTGQITFRAFRTYIGCVELLARREAADRVAAPSRIARQRRFLQSELSELVDVEEGRPIMRELSELETAGLLTFTERAITISEDGVQQINLVNLLGSRGAKRLVPVPRRILRLLASCTRPALAKTIVAYLLRGLSLSKRGEVRGAGTVKISWVCKLCQISERAARGARAELIRIGWITKDTGSYQRKLNRDGAYFVINTAWRLVSKRFAPPGTENWTGSAPPREIQETPNGSKNQKPAYAASGVQMERLKSPTLQDIQPEDLKIPRRVEELYRLAIQAGWLEHSEANVRNFVCAALRATRAGGKVGAIFVGIVRRRLWHHITQDQESRALAVLNRFREKHPEAFQLEKWAGGKTDPRVSGLVSVVLAHRGVGERCS